MSNNWNVKAMEYEDFVSALVKRPQAILDNLTPEKVDLIHAVFGIADEAGELVSAVKKYVIYGKELDLDNVVEELGDMEFYLEQIRQNLSLVRWQIIEKNKAKLSKRYATMTYSDEQAIARADKEPSSENK